MNNSISGLYNLQQEGQQIRVANRQLLFGLNLHKTVYFILYSCLSFCIMQIWSGNKGQIVWSLLISCGFGVLDIFYQHFSNCYYYWKDTLIDLIGIIIGIGIAILMPYVNRWLKKHIYVSEKEMEDNRIKKVLDIFALISVIQYIAYRFLQSTMFDFVYSNLYKYFTFVFLVGCGGIRFFYLIIQKLWGMKDEIYKINIIIILLLCGFLMLSFAYVGLKHDYKFLIFLPIVAISLYEMDSKRILKWFAWTLGILLSATIICCLAGGVRNIVLYESGRVIGAYGIINTSDFASYFTFLFLFIWCAQKNRHWLKSILFALVVGLANCILFWYTNSITAIICGILSVIVILWECLVETVFQKKKEFRKGEVFNRITVVAFPIMCLVIIFLTVLYANGNSWAIRINTLLNERLRVSLEPFEKYGIKLFGSTIPTMHGNGGTLIRRWISTGYEYMDVAYSMMVIRYGIIISLIIMVSWIFTTNKALRKGETRIALSMMIIAAHALTEARFLDVNYNLLLVMPFCTYKSSRFQAIGLETIWNRGKSEIKQHYLYWLFFSILIIFLWLTIPRIMSWLRTIIYLKGWTTGNDAWGSLLICLGIILMLVGLWKFSYTLTHHYKKTAYVSFVIILLLIIGSVIVGNNIIKKGLSEQTERLKEEERIVRLIQSVAEHPTYVAEESEIYQRKFGGFSEHVFSTEELFRTSQGTIFVDGSFESLSIRNMGGQYAQISQWSGIYSFDPAVIDSTKNEGLEWKTYYYGKRKYNLKELAIRNGLSLNEYGQLQLKGADQSLMEGIEMDQYWGRYIVTFSLLMPDCLEHKDDTICTLYVMADAGERVILEKSITFDDFDDTGKCEKELIYEIVSTPKMEYRILVKDGYEVFVKEITWQKLGWE